MPYLLPPLPEKVRQEILILWKSNGFSWHCLPLNICSTVLNQIQSRFEKKFMRSPIQSESSFLFFQPLYTVIYSIVYDGESYSYITVYVGYYCLLLFLLASFPHLFQMNHPWPHHHLAVALWGHSIKGVEIEVQEALPKPAEAGNGDVMGEWLNTTRSITRLVVLQL